MSADPEGKITTPGAGAPFPVVGKVSSWVILPSATLDVPRIALSKL